MSTTFWKQFAACIRAKHPGFFMYGEAFDYSPDNIGQYTWPQNGGISLLDFPLRGRIADVFEHSGSDYRSEEHTSELQSLMRISYAVFCLKKTNKKLNKH